MKRALLPFVLLFVLGLMVVLGIASYHKTDSTEVGVRTRKFAVFGRKGVEDRVYQPGAVYFFLPVLNDWSTFDTRLSVVEMKGDSDLAFKTIEGNDIHLDVVFSYRIDPQKAAFIRQFVARGDDELREKVFKTVALSRTRDFFGELTTEQFYGAEDRNDAAERAKAGLEAILEPYGIIVEKVGLMDYRFNPKYAEVIRDKKLAEAKKSELEAQIEAQRELNQKLLNEAQGQINQMIALVDAEYTNTTAIADAYYDQQSQLAEAIVREGQNNAEAIKKQREAMAAAGGETQVKMRIIENLKGKRILMIPNPEGAMNLQTLDLNELLKTYGVRALAQER